MSFDYSQYVKFVESLGIIKEDFQLWLRQFLLEQAQRVVREAKLRTPVDTGALINSYQIGSQKITLMDDPSGRMGLTSRNKHAQVIDPENSTIDSIAIVGDELYVEISNPMEYASYVEYGHHSYMGRYMLTIAVNDVQNALPTRFERQFQDFLKSKGVG